MSFTKEEKMEMIQDALTIRDRFKSLGHYHYIGLFVNRFPEKYDGDPSMHSQLRMVLCGHRIIPHILDDAKIVLESIEGAREQSQQQRVA